MSEQTAPAPAPTDQLAPAVPPTGGGEPQVPEAPGGEDQRVPYERFKEVIDQVKTLREQNEELARYREEQEAAKLSEVERETAARQAAEERAAAAELRALTLERTIWVTDAAKTAGFTDPQDAIAHLFSKLSEIEDQESAKKAVTELAAEKKHLLGSEKPTGFGSIGGQQKKEDVPLGEDGKPDVKLGLGRELMQGLLGGGKS